MWRVLGCAAVVACGGTEIKRPVSDLQDPTTCMDCHGDHYTEWSGSMHAYASDDPVFRAMEQRGQRETGGQLGMFCVQCHAPMAVALGTITPANVVGFDFSTLQPAERGITCYFCHDVKSVVADHNNGLVLAMDQTMRGGVGDPTDSPAHFSSDDKQLMRGTTNKSKMCGSCHDVTLANGVALETTFQEWQGSVFSHDDPASFVPQTCSMCHMQSEPDKKFIANKAGLDVRARDGSFHLHRFAAIDQATTAFPDLPGQTAAIHDILDPSLTIVGQNPVTGPPAPGGICLNPPGELTVRVDTTQIGHAFPSGAAQDRRAWLEVIAYDATDQVVFQSGVVPDGMDPEDIDDENLVAFWDRTFKADGVTPAHFFWEIASQKPFVLNAPLEFGLDHSRTGTYHVEDVAAQIDHITATLRVRALPYAVLRDLVASHDLAAMPAVPTLTSLATVKTWSKATAGMGQGSHLTFCNPNPAM